MALTWRDLYVIVRQSPRTSALARARIGEAATWGVNEYLLALIADILAGANWQRSGGRGQKPRPVKRPKSKDDRKALGAGAIPISDFDAWWNEAVPTES